MDVLEKLKKHMEWNESYYFNFHDKNNQLTAFMRIGNKVNKDEKSMFFYLMSPTMTGGIKIETPLDKEPWNIAGLKYQELDQDRWRLKYDGPIYNPPDKPIDVKMDVTWEALNPPMDYKECVNHEQVEMSSNVASQHYEQFGRASGIIEINQQHYNIKGYGERDLSLGIREWGSPKIWMWINSQFSATEAFNITKLSVEEGDVDAGYFHINKKNRPLIKSDIKVEYSRGTPHKFNMKLYDKKGNEYQVAGEVVRYGMVPVDEKMVLIETLSKYHWENKEGYGIAEFLVPKP
ncbi:MAG: hypothetical protein QME14_03720 [Methanobacteriaceae archaeon]|nr:hypothetical protein [Methanobacteriaceae archaeon]